MRNCVGNGWIREDQLRPGIELLNEKKKERMNEGMIELINELMNAETHGQSLCEEGHAICRQSGSRCPRSILPC